MESELIVYKVYKFFVEKVEDEWLKEFYFKFVEVERIYYEVLKVEYEKLGD